MKKHKINDLIRAVTYQPSKYYPIKITLSCDREGTYNSPNDYTFSIKCTLEHSRSFGRGNLMANDWFRVGGKEFEEVEESFQEEKKEFLEKVNKKIITQNKYAGYEQFKIIELDDKLKEFISITINKFDKGD